MLLFASLAEEVGSEVQHQVQEMLPQEHMRGKATP